MKHESLDVRKKRRVLPALLPLLSCALSACATAPLLPYDTLAFSHPTVASREDVPDRHAPERLGKALARKTRRHTRFRVASAPGDLSPRTALVHLDIRRCLEPTPGAHGAARLDCAFTDVRGTPLFASTLFTLAAPLRDPGEKNALSRAVASDFVRLLQRMGGRRLCGGPPGETEAEAASPFLRLPRPPRLRSRPSPPGRFLLRAAFGLVPLADTPSGKGRGAPDYDEAFSPGTLGDLTAGYAVCPGLEVSLGAGRLAFPGKTYEADGLEVAFDPFVFNRVFGETRLSLPLVGGRPERWWSAWDPFPDTRGAQLVAALRAGTAVHAALDVRVIRDDTGEAPALGPGEEIPYYRRGALFFGEALLGARIRMGDGRRFALSASLFAGFFWATPPVSKGVGSEAGPLQGTPVVMEIALGF